MVFLVSIMRSMYYLKSHKSSSSSDFMIPRNASGVNHSKVSLKRKLVVSNGLRFKVDDVFGFGDFSSCDIPVDIEWKVQLNL